MRAYSASVTFIDPFDFKANERFTFKAESMDKAHTQATLMLAHKIGDQEPYRITYLCIEEVEEQHV